MYCRTELALADAREKLMKSKEARRNKQFVEYLTKPDGYLTRVNRCSLAFRPAHCHHMTNNVCERTVGIFKDVTLSRVRAFNAMQLQEFLVTDFTIFFANKLIEVCAGQRKFKDNWLQHRRCEVISLNQICDALFELTSSSSGSTYLVNMEELVCSCSYVGTCCKHIVEISRQRNIELPTSRLILPTPAAKKLLAFIATGQQYNEDYFLGVNERDSAGIFKRVDAEPEHEPTPTLPSLSEPETPVHVDILREQVTETDIAINEVDDNDSTEELRLMIEKSRDQQLALLATMTNGGKALFKKHLKQQILAMDRGTLAFGSFLARCTDRRKNVGRKIGVQSTAIGRRTKKNGTSTRLPAGRPRVKKVHSLSQKMVFSK